MNVPPPPPTPRPPNEDLQYEQSKRHDKNLMETNDIKTKTIQERRDRLRQVKRCIKLNYRQLYFLTFDFLTL